MYQYDFRGSSYLLTYYESDECVESDLMKLNESMSQKGPVPLRLRKDRGVMVGFLFCKGVIVIYYAVHFLINCNVISILGQLVEMLVGS